MRYHGSLALWWSFGAWNFFTWHLKLTSLLRAWQMCKMWSQRFFSDLMFTYGGIFLRFFVMFFDYFSKKEKLRSEKTKSLRTLNHNITSLKKQQFPWSYQKISMNGIRHLLQHRYWQPMRAQLLSAIMVKMLQERVWETGRNCITLTN